MIWPRKIALKEIQDKENINMVAHLGIHFTAIEDDSLCARMPVDFRTQQPWGLLHGGASVALAETIGSMASMLVLENQPLLPVGLEINANHLRSVTEGFVEAVCRPIHLGRRTHVWDIKISDPKGKLVCVSRLTIAVIEKT